EPKKSNGNISYNFNGSARCGQHHPCIPHHYPTFWDHTSASGFANYRVHGSRRISGTGGGHAGRPPGQKSHFAAFLAIIWIGGWSLLFHQRLGGVVGVP